MEPLAATRQHELGTHQSCSSELTRRCCDIVPPPRLGYRTNRRCS
jgi:hypothetical protein